MNATGAIGLVVATDLSSTDLTGLAAAATELNSIGAPGAVVVSVINFTGSAGLVAVTVLNATGARGLACADSAAAMNISNSSATTLDEAQVDRHKNIERKR
ncbi:MULTISPECIES: hypothetical protein [Pseudomonas]|uniref:hypothetical protein n=1 Tax=Pseudomonas TaxID=286 RepID=UPI00211571EC|nr:MULTISPECIES: hypothetical protein [Pseudomonas]